jgi:hypothetical protein
MEFFLKQQVDTTEAVAPGFMVLLPSPDRAIQELVVVLQT